MPDTRHIVQFPSGHTVTFPAGTPEKEVARQAAHIHHFSLKKLGAPVDFGGPVFPNPKGLKPQLDTERPKPTGPILPKAPLGNPQMDVHNPGRVLPEPNPMEPREQ